MPTFRDLTGGRFDRWTVLRRGPNDRTNKSRWECECVCGAVGLVYSFSLLDGTSRSCGCLIRDVNVQRLLRHGLARSGHKHPLYATWHGILARCEKPRQSGYRRYGGRGITVCERWHDINAFLADVGSRPSPQHSLDRVDPDGAYEPTNVRWATASEQSRNWSPSTRATRIATAATMRRAKLKRDIERLRVALEARRLLQAAGVKV